MQIEITKKSELRKDGKWNKLDLEFIRDGKKNKRTLVAIGESKEVVRALDEDYNVGDTVEIKLVKSEDGEFWNWVGVSKVEGQAAAAKTSYQVKSTYETPEERAKKQVYIVRQSSIGSAIEYFTANGKKFTTDEVMQLAQTFTSFVFGSPVAKKEEKEEEDMDNFKDDVPF